MPGRTLAIVGGGVSGALLAIHLLRRSASGTSILLIERRPTVGPGVAYSTDCPAHVLNVQAGNMGLLPGEPEGFLRWVRDRRGFVGFPDSVQATDFLPRSLYGAYVADSLESARASAPAGVALETLVGEVIDLEEIPGGARLLLADGRTRSATAVVLAIGNLPGEYPIKRSMPFYKGPRYVHVPWLASLMGNITKADDVLVVGSGPTAVDIILQLDSLGHHGTIHALSRRGLRPLAQVTGLAPHPSFLAEGRLPTKVTGCLRLLRSEARKAAENGGDWRSVIDAVRPFTQAIWAGFSNEERARFMRHARPFWEVHRHRISPQTLSTVRRLEAEGRVRFVAGRLESLRDMPTQAEAVYRQRGTGSRVTLRVAKVINCTGPRTDYSKYQHPLLINLLARGLIDHDPLALGIKALPSFDVLRYRGGPAGWLFTIGAPLKGMLWESTAIAEIRVQAQALADQLIARY
jgi:uncharacterized NAD(P)/FAD-binding protein YdhS